MKEIEDFDDWLALGIERGFCGPPVCSTHDGIPTSEEEDLEWEEYDPCVHVIRPYTGPDHKAAVEENHSPSTWRDTWSKKAKV
tara:strand:+ start:1860 stop:2108 length:249 start_codon:yes stop_codon:yes gene_type:complete